MAVQPALRRLTELDMRRVNLNATLQFQWLGVQLPYTTHGKKQAQ
ncbi:hypothetical protein ENT52713_02670 [Enterobacter sp. 200527-13]|nr:hypothetical protein ENT52713_02670 [Enterobacter sp. 200527-13]